MSDFEHDDQLRDALRRAHPARTEAGPTLAASRTRMARARSRRRAALGSIAAASFVAIGAAVFAANTTSDNNVVDVLAPPSTVSIVSTAPGDQPGTTTNAPQSTSTTRVGADPTTTVAPPPTSSTQPATTTTVPTTTTGAARTTHIGRGGTITVMQTATAMTLEQITDVVGWMHTVNKNDSDDIEVEWRRGNPEDQAKIRLRLIDGSIREEID
jgi:hypothetical protein